MGRTVVAIYDSFQRANSAVRELVDNGFPRDSISIIATNMQDEQGSIMAPGDESAADETGTGAGVGAGIGAAIGGIGGLLVGLGALIIPGIGPVLAAGPLAVALSTLTGAGVGAVAGGVTGGLLGALIGLGVPEEEAEFYTEGVRRGGVLVTAQTEDYNTEQIMTILNRHQPVNIKERVSEWRAQGWTGYDPAAQTQESHPTGEARFASDITEGRPGIARDPSGDMDATRPNAANRPAEHSAEFDLDSPVYRNHYHTFLAGSNDPFDYYVPAYRYGHSLSADPRFRNRSWLEIEPDVRREWETDHPGSWDRFSAAIRQAWDDQVNRT